MSYAASNPGDLPRSDGGASPAPQPTPQSGPLSEYNPERIRGEGVPGSAKPSLTIEEAAAQLARYGTSLAGTGVYHQPTVVTYAFRASANTLPDGVTDFSRFNANQIAAAELALASWADVANITFVRVGSGTSGNDAYSNAATILFANYGSGQASAAAFAYLPGDNSAFSEDSDVWINGSIGYNATPVRGDYGQQVLTHEIGHAIGLEHPSDYNAGEGEGEITYANSASYFEDSRQYSLMSYFGGVNTGAGFPAFSATPGMDDIAAAQLLYGANMTTRTGDTVYGFNSNAGQVWFQSVAFDGSDLVFCAWDAGGNDTFDFSGYLLDAFVDLRAAHFSNVGTGVANVSIAAGVTIENAIGGAGNDHVIGNEVANVISGLAGDDRLEGGGGNDRLDGGGGNDVMAGEAGDDTYVVDALTDSLSEAAGGGVDTVLATVSWTLGAAVENLILGGAGDVSGTGNELDNLLTGNGGANNLTGNAGNDRLDGGGGADILTGGTGDDTYLVDSVLDTVTELSGEGADTVRSLVDWTLGLAVENLILEGVANLSGTGNELDNTVTGNGGNNRLDGGGGADVLIGGAGDDTYLVDIATDNLVEAPGEGTDTVRNLVDWTLGSAFENLILDGAANLSGTGNELDNALTGNSGNNRLDGGTGADILAGGAGDDIYIVDSLADSVIEAAGQGVDTVNALVDWTLGLALENLILLGTENLSGAGNSADNVLIGNGGVNSLSGGGGNDRLIANGGADRLDGGIGGDAMFGGAGDDTYVVDAATDKVLEANNSGSDLILTLVTFALTGLYVENETLLGSADINALGNGFDNVLIGNSGANTLNGGRGLDIMTGGEGNDIYFVDNVGDVVTEASGGGRDAVFSSISYALTDNVESLVLTGYQAINATGNALDNALTGNDNINFLSGGDGRDVFHGFGGRDVLSGGAGADLFVFAAAGAANGLDRLTDFVSGEDHLAFLGSDYGFERGHVLTAAEYHKGGAVGAFAQFVYNTVNHTLYWDGDGAGAAAPVGVAVFDNGVMPVASDFIFQ